MKFPEMAIRARRYAPIAAAMLIGATVGVLAWGEGRSAQLAVLLPVLVAITATRSQAFALAFGYAMGAARGCPDYAVSWFNDSMLVGYALWLSAGLLGGLGWSLAWSSSDKPWRKALATAVAYVVTLIPPIAILTTGHVLVAWGFLLRGWGWVGVAVSLIAPAALVWLIAKHKPKRAHVAASLAAVAVALTAASFAYEKDEDRYLNDIVAVSTKFGAATRFGEILDRVTRMGRTTAALAGQDLASVVIFPESIIQTYSPAIFPFLDGEILRHSEEAGQTVVLGADLTLADGSMQNAAIAFYPDGRTLTAVARQTVPFALWKPWAAQGSFKPDWTTNSVLPLRDGVHARMVFCYEEYIPLLGLIDEAKGGFQLVVVMANTWAAKKPYATAIQARHSEGLARLFGRKLLRAENRPKDQS